MDDSQSSDIFSDFANKSCDSASNNMDTNSYDSLLKNTKDSLLCSDFITKSSFSLQFTQLLEDCRLCISQSLNFISLMLSDTNTDVDRMLLYMEDAVTVLQMLSSFIKTVVESVSMVCCTLTSFPTTTGHILLEVFTHCKNSESLYGEYLSRVEKPLKDLFRTCHELQLTYLMVLEKHFIFDLTEKEELDILIEALFINLHIGEVVQTLDVKTMAEQWKGYTMICEKYATHLMDKHVYQECTRLLCSMILDNIRTITETNIDEKLIVRSMKVTNFTIKILLKIYIIFKLSTSKPYTNIVDVLNNVYIFNPAYLKTEGKSDQFINAITNNIMNPCDLLLKELGSDNEFINVILKSDLQKLKGNDKCVGFIYLVVNVIKVALQDPDPCSLPKDKMLRCVFNILPQTYVWCSLDMQFKSPQGKTLGLFEYMLIHCASLALTMNRNEMAALERNMVEVLLSTDTMSSLFASNLWILIARLSNNKTFIFHQVLALCQIYQKLENMEMFAHSPQKVHLSNTMCALFETMGIEEKVKIYKQLDPLSHPKLWAVLKITNLTIDLQMSVERDVIDKFYNEQRKFAAGFQKLDSFVVLMDVMNLLSTCSLRVLEGLQDTVIDMWLKACPKNLRFLSELSDRSTLWYLAFIESLVALTVAMKCVIYGKSSNVVKILHVISNITSLDNVELNLSVIDFIIMLASNPIHDENKVPAGNSVVESIKNLIHCSNCIVRNKLFHAVKRKNSKYLNQMVSSIVNGNNSIEDEWRHFVSEDRTSYIAKLKEQLKLEEDYFFTHKCIKTKPFSKNPSPEESQNSCNSNFDLADIDTLFDNESDSEPASKKPKIDCNEAENILIRLEQDVMLLASIKENITFEHKRRIELLHEKLKDIVS